MTVFGGGGRGQSIVLSPHKRSSRGLEDSFYPGTALRLLLYGGIIDAVRRPQTDCEVQCPTLLFNSGLGQVT